MKMDIETRCIFGAVVMATIIIGIVPMLKLICDAAGVAY